MKTIPRGMATVTAIDCRLEPALTVSPGETFAVETEDASGGWFRDSSASPDPRDRPTHTADPPHLNPTAGPVYIEGAEKGDTVVVTIESIEPDTQGYTMLQPGEGLFGDSVAHRELNNLDLRILEHLPGASGTTTDGICRFSEILSWPLAPHIGTMCLAPEREVHASVLIQGPYGGNMDSRDFRTGAKVHLACSVDGGLLFVGDVHACEGDGELTWTADETRARVILSCDVIKGVSPRHVRIETPESLIGCACGKPLETAVRDAVANLLDWLTSTCNFSERDAYYLIGLCPEFRINVYQMAAIPGLSFTAGAEVPRRFLERTANR